MTVARTLSVSVGGVLFWALFFGGGDSPFRLAWVGGAALIAAALAAAAALDARIPRPALGRYGLGFVACFAGLVLWQGLSILWSVEPDKSWSYVNRGVVYLAFLLLGCFLGAFVSMRAVARGFGVLVAAAIGYALLAKGIPALYPDYERLARLRSPVGYWNALALVGDFAFVLGLWRAAERKLDGIVLVFAATVAILLAYSRGGIVLAILGAALWLAFDRRRLEALTALALGGGVGVAAGGLAFLLHGVSDDQQSHATRVHDGWVFLALLVAGKLVVLGGGYAFTRIELTETARRRATQVLFAVVALGCALGIVAAALRSGGSTVATPAGTHCVQSVNRFACGSSDERLDWWGESWDSFTASPFEGTGAGSFDLAHRLRRSHYTRPVTEPHNFALQTLGETGIVGFLLFAGAVALAALAIRRRLRGDDAATVLAICVLLYLVHILIDIGYDFVAVSGPAFVLLGVLLARPGRVVARRERIWSLGALLLAATAVFSLVAPLVAQRKTEEAARTGDPAFAVQAHAWNPVAVDPLHMQAVIEEGLGNKLKALQLYREAVDTQPENPDTWIELGTFELDVMKDPCNAYRHLNEAYTLDRFNPVVAEAGGPLDKARRQVNNGACE
jgi:hypothetical protein